MFEYYNNTLCVQANWLAKEGITTLDALMKMTQRGKIQRARTARGLGNCALYIYASLPERFKNIIEHDLGINPTEQSSTISLSEYLKSDENENINLPFKEGIKRADRDNGATSCC